MQALTVIAARFPCNPLLRGVGGSGGMRVALACLLPSTGVDRHSRPQMVNPIQDARFRDPPSLGARGFRVVPPETSAANTGKSHGETDA